MLGPPGHGTIPHDPKRYLTVRMSFEPGTGETPDDWYVIYVDPDTYRMRAAEYVVTYGTMLDLFGLPPEATYFGPLIHVYDAYETVDGLLVPVRYRTFDLDGKLYGTHVVRSWSFHERFDPARVVRPPGAVVDTSSPRRRADVSPSSAPR